MATAPTAFGLYWRRNKFFGGLCPPGVLAIAGGRLVFTTADGTIFDLPLTGVRARLSGWGTLTISSPSHRRRGAARPAALHNRTAAGDEPTRESSWDLLATAGPDSRPFGASLLRELVAAGGRRPVPTAGIAPVKECAETLRQHGVTVEIHRSNNLYWLYGSLGVALAVAALVVWLTR